MCTVSIFNREQRCNLYYFYRIKSNKAIRDNIIRSYDKMFMGWFQKSYCSHFFSQQRSNYLLVSFRRKANLVAHSLASDSIALLRFYVCFPTLRKLSFINAGKQSSAEGLLLLSSKYTGKMLQYLALQSTSRGAHI